MTWMRIARYSKNVSIGCLGFVSLIISSIPPVSVHAQAITPAADGTGTVVTSNGQEFTITGGTQAGANLFHSFQQFGLDANQIATFLATPDLQNILSRVVGGDPSVINGLLQVTGGSPNFYLMNPAGIIFGANTSLNVPASFTATTATGIQVGSGGDGGWFAAYGSNNYSALLGNPTAFLFTSPSSPTSLTSPTGASLINAGTLAVKPGQSLNLIGGTVINTGTLTAPGGSITVMAVPNSSLVRLSQPGSLLSLEIDSSGLCSGCNGLFSNQPSVTSATPSVATLPQLLTGSGLSSQATGLTVDADGTVRLTASNTAVPQQAGTTIVAGTIDVAQVAPPQPLLKQGLPDSEPPLSRGVGGIIHLLGDRVGLFSSTINASGINGGGTVLIGGDFQGKGSVPNAQMTVMDANSTINADALTIGNGGKVILWADQTTQFLGTISARGGSQGGDGGFIETSGKIVLQALGTVDASAPMGNSGTWLLDPNNITIQTAGGDTNVTGNPSFTTTNDGAIVTTGSIETALNAGTNVTITTASAGTNTEVGDITVSNNITKSAGGDASLTLQADRNITVSPGVQVVSTSNRLNVTFNADRDNDSVGFVFLNPSSGINTNGGNIVLGGGTTPSSSPAFANAGTSGVFVGASASLNTGSGNITLTGNSAFASIAGVNVLGILSTTTGTITIVGNNTLTTVSDAPGVSIAGTGSINTGTGTIAITGTTSGTSTVGCNCNNGVSINKTITATGTGTIAITGNSTNAAGTNDAGVSITAGSVLDASSGTLTVTGTGAGTGATANGVTIGNNITPTVLNGSTITITGTSSSATANASGVSVGTVNTGVTNNLTITGTSAGSGAASHGIAVSGPLTSSSSGRISLIGNTTNAGGTGSGVTITAPITTGTGNLTVTGNNSGGGSGIRTTAVLNTGTGNITLTGTSVGAGNASVDIASNLTTTSGAINITGTNSGGAGVTISAPSVQTGTGNITISGTGSGTASGLTIQPTITSNMTVASTSGSITLTGRTASTSVADLLIQGFSSRTVTIAPGTGTLLLNADRPLLGTGATIQGTGTLAVLPLTAGTALTIGGTGSTITDFLTTSELATLANGFNRITLGNAANPLALTGTITVSDPLSLLASTTSSNSSSLVGTDNASISITTTNALVAGNVSTQGQPISLNGASVQTETISTTPTGSSGGAVSITATTGNISTGSITTQGFGSGGNVNLSASNGSLQVGTISAQATTIGNGGTVTLKAGQTITTGAINTSTPSGNAGNVTIDPPGLTQVTFINAESRSGRGGTVSINETTTNPGLFRATGSFTAIDGTTASISTYGTTGSGAITIRHGGGSTSPVTPFVVGQSSSNGTVGAITSSSSSATNTIASGSFPQSYTQGNIRLITSSTGSTGTGSTGTGSTDITTTQDDSPNKYETAKQPTTTNTSSSTTPIFESATQTLQRLEQATGKKPAIIYVSFLPTTQVSSGISSTYANLPGADDNFFADYTGQRQPQTAQDKDTLELVIVSANNKPIRVRVPKATRAQVTNTAQLLELYVRAASNKDGYRAPAQQLYQWMIQPIEAELKRQKIDTLVFSMDEGLRTLPIAVLHDGSNYLVQTYSVAITPSFNLTDTRYQSLKNLQVLGMGASTFPNSTLENLDAVPIELQMVQTFWRGRTVLNQGFNLDNLQAERKAIPFGIIHLATHANFNDEEAYIQLWDRRLQTDQLRQLGWNNPPVELLILSACKTAVGDRDIELGFAGLAVRAGVKSVLASLWKVDDEGTMTLMSEFYRQLNRPEVTIKAEALRQAQLAMISGKARPENGVLKSDRGTVKLPPALADRMATSDLSHPYYWAAFTLVGSPW